MNPEPAAEPTTIPSYHDKGTIHSVTIWWSNDTLTHDSASTDPDDYPVAGAVDVTTSVVPGSGDIAIGIFLSAIVLLTVAGNVLVILSVFTYRPLRIPPNYFIASLAVTDIAVAVLVVPLSIPYLMIRQWIFGSTLCRAWATLNVMCCYASILHLCAIAVDRYRAIKDPIPYAKERTLRRILLTIVGMWLFSGLVSMPLMFWRVEEFSERFSKEPICTLKSFDAPLVAGLIASFYLTVLVTGIVYALIFITMRRRLNYQNWNSHLKTAVNFIDPVTARHSGTWKEEVGNKDESLIEKSKHDQPCSKALSYCKRFNVSVVGEVGVPPASETLKKSFRRKGRLSLQQIPLDGNVMVNGGLVVEERAKFVGRSQGQKVSVTEEMVDGSKPSRMTNLIQQFMNERQRVSQSKERKLARTLGLIMGALAMCWLPFFITFIVVAFCRECRPSKPVQLFIAWLGYMNSTLNPIIYTWCNAEFRRAFKRILRIKS